MEQIRILIGSIDDDNARNNMFRFWQKSLKRKDYNDELGTGGVQGQIKGQRLMGIKEVNDSIGLATCQSKIYEK